jgi:phage tail-like protein
VLAYKIYRCWPSLYQALPLLDANSAEVAIEQLVLENEGWERDISVTESIELS